MRAALLCAVMAVAVGSVTQAATDTWHVAVDDAQTLQDQLLALARERLRGTGLIIDPQRVWMNLSAALPATDRFEVRPTWSADAPTLPLTFELHPASRAALATMPGRASGAPPIQVTLGVTLLREVWVAARRLRKGSLVSCADLTLERRRVQDLPRLSLAGACAVAPDAVSLRDIAAGGVLRGTDIGKAPDVMAGTAVRVSVATRGINVTTSAVALADARVGDQIDVRLQRPARTLRTRVLGPGLVRLLEESP